jgi:hypothetical protein
VSQLVLEALPEHQKLEAGKFKLEFPKARHGISPLPGRISLPKTASPKLPQEVDTANQNFKDGKT